MICARSHSRQAEGLVFTLAGSRVPVFSHKKMSLLKVGRPQRQICALAWGHTYSLRKQVQPG